MKTYLFEQPPEDITDPVEEPGNDEDISLYQGLQVPLRDNAREQKAFKDKVVAFWKRLRLDSPNEVTTTEIMTFARWLNNFYRRFEFRDTDKGILLKTIELEIAKHLDAKIDFVGFHKVLRVGQSEVEALKNHLAAQAASPYDLTSNESYEDVALSDEYVTQFLTGQINVPAISWRDHGKIPKRWLVPGVIGFMANDANRDSEELFEKGTDISAYTPHEIWTIDRSAREYKVFLRFMRNAGYEQHLTFDQFSDQIKEYYVNPGPPETIEDKKIYEFGMNRNQLALARWFDQTGEEEISIRDLKNTTFGNTGYFQDLAKASGGKPITREDISEPEPIGKGFLADFDSKRDVDYRVWSGGQNPLASQNWAMTLSKPKDELPRKGLRSETFSELKQMFHYIDSGHPKARDAITIGWVRFTILDEGKVWIDEIQSDIMGQVRFTDKELEVFDIRKAPELLLGTFIGEMRSKGYNEMFMPSPEMKRSLYSAGPPKSIYTHLPKRFGFQPIKFDKSFIDETFTSFDKKILLVNEGGKSIT
ncbi:MAG TPA: hypothetical protein ENI23_14305, partial [bacterium]|nr:hypothetical protein [bacterium]